VTAKDRSRRPHLARLVTVCTVPVVAAGFLTGQALAPGAAHASPCENGHGSYRWYATDQSGSGSNKGTGGYMQTWTHWSLDGHPTSDTPFSDEAVWTYDQNNGNDALEVGFSTGYGGGSGRLTNNMYPYVTVNNDQNPPADETDFQGTSLPTNTNIWNSATSDGHSTWAFVNNRQIAYFANYGVATPRVNYEQAEVNYQDIWMGGGSGSSMALSYQTPSNQWKPWGAENAATFWVDANGNAHYPAGHGYFANATQPNVVVEGGYGQTC
jgi:hypothetical protein